MTPITTYGAPSSCSVLPRMRVVAAELRLPEAVAEDDRPRVASPAVAVSNTRPMHRRDAEQRKHLAVTTCGRDPHRLAGADQVDGGAH